MKNWELLEKSKKIRNLMDGYFKKPQMFHSKDILAQLEIPEIYIFW